MFVYLDNSATTKQAEEVTRAEIEAAERFFGNPSSLYRLGLEAEKFIRECRNAAAALIGSSPQEIYFTSGGTESDNTAVYGAVRALKRQGKRIITTEIEHPAVLECFADLEEQGMDVIRIPVDREGIIDKEAFRDAVNDDTILVSVMHVNNETGAVQPVEELGKIIREKSRALFHCDAVQSYGKLPVDVKKAGIDLLSASGHKIHGPRGTGILYVSGKARILPLIRGGGQEKGLRSGTENVPGIAGFACAARMASEGIGERLSHVRQLSGRLIGGILEKIPDVTINGPEREGDPGAGRWMPYIVNVSFADCRAEVLLHMLEQHEVYVSTGSACSSHKKGYSHVLKAMGAGPKEAEGAVRFSLSPYTTEEEIDYALEVLCNAVAEHRKMMAIARRMGR